MTVEKLLSAIDGVLKAEVNLEQKMAIIETDKEIDNEMIITLIKDEGFEVLEIE